MSRPAGSDEQQPDRRCKARHATRQPTAPRGVRTELDHACPPELVHYTLRVYIERIRIVHDGIKVRAHVCQITALPVEWA